MMRMKIFQHFSISAREGRKHLYYNLTRPKKKKWLSAQVTWQPKSAAVVVKVDGAVALVRCSKNLLISCIHSLLPVFKKTKKTLSHSLPPTFPNTCLLVVWFHTRSSFRLSSEIDPAIFIIAQIYISCLRDSSRCLYVCHT